MTTPTQAQIEAATEAVYAKAVALNPQDDKFPISKTRCRKYAEAALAAAAEVTTVTFENVSLGNPDDRVVITPAQLAAAAVGVHPAYPEYLKSEIARLEMALEEAELAATVERCAQVAEQQEWTTKQCAAAIRALKEPLPSVNWKDGKPYNYCPECGRQDNILDAATIERCAQVAKSFRKRLFNHPMEMADAIEAAIRKLNEPQIDPNIVYPGKDPDFIFPEE